ncbi:MAG: hypothetical protein HC923_12020 [Myxococcales bacterium]|nr:hypothetical protein [Myxococcales bacterium]
MARWTNAAKHSEERRDLRPVEGICRGCEEGREREGLIHVFPTLVPGLEYFEVCQHARSRTGSVKRLST